MKKHLVILIILFSIVANNKCFAEFVSIEKLNVRNVPNGQIITTLNKMQHVIPLSKSGSWTKIQWYDNIVPNTGWVATQYLTKQYSPQTFIYKKNVNQDEMKVKINESRLKCDKYPGTTTNNYDFCNAEIDVEVKYNDTEIPYAFVNCYSLLNYTNILSFNPYSSVLNFNSISGSTRFSSMFHNKATIYMKSSFVNEYAIDPYLSNTRCKISSKP